MRISVNKFPSRKGHKVIMTLAPSEKQEVKVAEETLALSKKQRTLALSEKIKQIVTTCPFRKDKADCDVCPFGKEKDKTVKQTATFAPSEKKRTKKAT